MVIYRKLTRKNSCQLKKQIQSINNFWSKYPSDFGIPQTQWSLFEFLVEKLRIVRGRDIFW